MSVIEFLTRGGIASIGGDFSIEEQKKCNNIIKRFGEEVQKHAIEYHIYAAEITILNASCLIVAKDQHSYFFVFVNKPGGNQITYKDLSKFGQIDLETIVERVKIEIGEVIWGFMLPIHMSINEIRKVVINYLETLIQNKRKAENRKFYQEATNNPELSPFISKFRNDYPENTKTAFIMMKFSETPAHIKITNEIKRVMKKHGIVALRADDKEYSDDLFTNIRVYMHCCDFGIAVFERLLEDDFNPNVSLEVGYMFGLNKPVCLLKDSTLKSLHTDLVGKLYKEFNPQDIENTIEGQLEKWLKDKGII